MVLWSKLAYSSIAELQTCSGLILVASPLDFFIDMYDQKGNPVRTIKKDYPKRKVTSKDKQQIAAVWQESPYIRTHWQDIKKVVRFPAEFPAIKRVSMDNGQIFVQTYKREKERSEFFIFGADGKELKRILLPLRYVNIVEPYLYTIHGGKLYQLVEDEEEEEWRLVITEI